MQVAVRIRKKQVSEESEEKVMIENKNLKQSNGTVKITQHRYEQLLDIETRVEGKKALCLQGIPCKP